MTRIAVAGAGIAGCAVAAALRTAGFHVTLFDENLAGGDGSVLLLWPNGMKAAERLGIAGEIRRRGTKVRGTDFKTWAGESLWKIDGTTFERRYGAASYLISRSDLLQILRAAAGTVQAATFRGLADHGFSVTVLASPALGAHHGLVGCDGLESAVREALRPDELRSAYHSAWIGLSDVSPSDWPYDPGQTVAFLGRNLRLCASTMKPRRRTGVPPGTREVYWYASEPFSNPWNGRPELGKRALIELYAERNASVANLIEASFLNPTLPARRIRVRDRLPVRRWSYNRVTLSGDAAHPMTPDLGQGANQALESAVVLSRCLAETDDVPKAFSRYERLRIDRVAKVNELSRATSIFSMIRGPGIDALREAGIKTMLPAIARAEFDALFAVDF